MRMSINGCESGKSKCAVATGLEGIHFWMLCSDFGTEITNIDFTTALGWFIHKD